MPFLEAIFLALETIRTAKLRSFFTLLGIIVSVGFLVAEGPKFVSLAQEVLPDGDGFRAVTHIPLPVVERLVFLDAATGLATP